MEGLRRLPRRIGERHHWVVRQSSHLAVPMEELDFAPAHMKAPPVHLMLPKDHATLLVPRDDGELEPHVPSMQALRQIKEEEWRSLAARTRAHTPLAGACEAVPLRRCTMALHTGTCCGRVMAAYPPCKSCGGGSKKSAARWSRRIPVSYVEGPRRTLATCAYYVRGTKRWCDPCVSAWRSSLRSFPWRTMR